MTEWVRVKDMSTGHEYPAAADTIPPGGIDGLQVLVNKPAVTAAGDPLPAKPNRHLADLTVPQLKAYADSSGIDLDGASAKADIVSAIDAAEEFVINASEQGDDPLADPADNH